MATAGSVESLRSARDYASLPMRRTVVAALLVAGGYYAGAKLGFALTFQSQAVSTLWPPNSVLMAALLLTPVRAWWLILLAALPVHWAAQLQNHVPPLMIL